MTSVEAATDEALFQEVVRHIGEFLEVDTSHLKPESRLAGSIEGLSSLKLYEMMLYLEECMGFEFDEKVVDRIDTLQALVDYIRDHKRQ